MLSLLWILFAGAFAGLWEGAVLPFLPTGLRVSWLVVTLVITLLFLRQKSRIVWLGVVQALFLQMIFLTGMSAGISIVIAAMAFLLQRFWISARTLPAVFLFTFFLEFVRVSLGAVFAAIRFGSWRLQFEVEPWESLFWSACLVAILYSLGLSLRRIALLYRPRRREDGA